ncbi:MAG: hypothetical protein ACLTYN_00400 [Dysosmobacter welbionis]
MTQAAGIGTKAQQALKLQQEQGKQAVSPAPANSGRRRKRGSSSCGRRVERKAQRSLTSVLFREPFSYGGCERRQTLL